MTRSATFGHTHHRLEPTRRSRVGRPANGIGHESVVSCDNIVTIEKNALGDWIGYLLPAQEPLLTAPSPPLSTSNSADSAAVTSRSIVQTVCV